MPRRKKKPGIKPGYRAPRSAAEQQFWDLYEPNYRAWATKRKRLKLDEISALAMGLDPRSIEHMQSENNQTFARFESTRAWFRDVEKRFKERLPGDILGISVIAMDYHLPVPRRLTETATFAGEGLLDGERTVAKLEHKISRQEEKIAKLQKVIVDLKLESGNKPKVIRKSDESRAESATSKLIIALLAEVMRRNGLNCDLQLVKLKNGVNNKCVSQALSAILETGWKMDESTVGRRLDEAIKVWTPA